MKTNIFSLSYCWNCGTVDVHWLGARNMSTRWTFTAIFSTGSSVNASASSDRSPISPGAFSLSISWGFFFFFCDLISRIDGTWFQLGFFRLVQDILGFHNDAEGSKGSQGLNCSQCLTVSSLSSLIDCLFDSFDVNKEMALELLKSPPLLKLMNQVFGYLIDSLFSCYWRRLSIGSIE